MIRNVFMLVAPIDSSQEAMSSSNKSRDCVPFRDITNTASTTEKKSPWTGGLGGITGGQINTSISKTPALDPKEHKKQREKERYARNKEEILRRKRERYHQKKAESRLIKKVEKEEANANESIAQVPDESRSISNQDMDIDGSSGWLHRNDAYMRPPSEQENINPTFTKETYCDLTPTSMVIDGTPRIIVPAPMRHVTDDVMPTSEVLEHVSETLKDNLATLSDHITGKS
ncbi:hypothetical protein ACP4OV_012987 [Aristida adscensionis]